MAAARVFVGRIVGSHAARPQSLAAVAFAGPIRSHLVLELGHGRRGFSASTLRRADPLAQGAGQPRKAAASVPKQAAASVPKPPSPANAQPLSPVLSAAPPPPRVDTVPVAAPTSPPPPPPPRPRRGRIRTWIVRFARLTLVLVLSAASYIGYASYQQRHPGAQLAHDPSKPTVVVLGSGWASTSFIKDVDTSEFNVIVISPRNYFLFSPLLPSVTVGTLDARSIIEPTRFIARHKKRRIEVIEGEVETVDPAQKTVTFVDTSDIKGETTTTTIPYDYLIYGIGAENATFGIPGVREHACFLKELWDADKLRRSLMDCIETATFKGQSESEIERLLHMVVVGGGPTGVEYAAELHDFLAEDLAQWYPEIKDKVKITLVEALPQVLPMFSKQLIDYATSTMSSNKIEIRTKTMVKNVTEKSITVQTPDKTLEEIPYGLLVWATGNTAREVTRKLMKSIGAEQNSGRGLLVDDFLRLKGADNIYAMGDCTSTSYSTAQQQGRYLSRVFAQLGEKNLLEAEIAHIRKQPRQEQDKERLHALTRAHEAALTVKPFSFSNQGSLAYVGSDKAIGDFSVGGTGNVAAAGMVTFLVWRSAYLSKLFSLRNRLLVGLDWIKCRVLGRDISRA